MDPLRYLSPEWASEEIKVFHGGFLEFGKNFGPIAKLLKGRSERMCRRLYNANKNYLGMRRTSADVLVSHMKDVYSMLNGELSPELDSSAQKRRRRRGTTAGSKRKSPAAKGRSATKRGRRTPPKKGLVRKAVLSPSRRRKRQLFPNSPLNNSPIVSRTSKTHLASHQVKDDNARRKLVLTNGLTSKLQKWCLYEWFYSGIDRDYFEHNEFQEELNDMGLGMVEKLTRAEWALVRQQMGPCRRRLSVNYFRKEIERLEQYREEVRRKQRGHRMNDAFIYEVPALLSVGQRVSALHPTKGILGVGSVLIVDGDEACYQIQFDRQDFGVQKVSDTLVMPHGQWEVVMTRKHGFDHNFGGSSASIPGVGPHHVTGTEKRFHTKQVASEGDIKSMVNFMNLLTRKKALLKELQHMNQDAKTMCARSTAFPPAFQQSYSWLLVNLKETNSALKPAALDVQRRFQPMPVREGHSGSSLVSKAWLRSFCAMCVQGGHKLLSATENQTRNHLPPAPVAPAFGPQPPSVRKVVEAALALMFGLRTCGDEAMAPQAVETGLDKLLEGLRPHCCTNLPLFNKLKQTVETLKGMCIVQPVKVEW